MNILLTGVTGYIGGRLLPTLLEEGHQVYACIRDRARFPERYLNHPCLKVVEVDFLHPNYEVLPLQIDVAFYLIHSMVDSRTHFIELEQRQAQCFVRYMEQTTVKQVIYLSGITSDSHLSPHLQSRKQVAHVLAQGRYALTVIKAAIIIGSGSASFEIMYDLVDRLPLMVGPNTLNNVCQPIAIRNVIYYLRGVMLHPDCMGEEFEIGGPQLLSYREMLRQIAQVRKLRRTIYTVPWISATLCAHWFYFITSVSSNLAVSLSDSMKNNEICSENRIATLLPQPLLSFKEMVEVALFKLSTDDVLSSWKDSFSSSGLDFLISNAISVPQTGALTYGVECPLAIARSEVIERIWQTGGRGGWWFANWLWHARGWVDLMSQGMGMRGRTNEHHLSVGDAIDFWRVLVADKRRGRLLLYAEMVMPGEGWLEFTIKEINQKEHLSIKATFRPRGISGRLYWLSTKPLHYVIFHGMAKKLTH
ncbi:MAG: SDR family oxidoreductase [Phocaeicola sp.]